MLKHIFEYFQGLRKYNIVFEEGNGANFSAKLAIKAMYGIK
jgi:hypothetical protein